MANYADNILTIRGPQESVDRFCRLFAERGFAGTAPEPEDANQENSEVDLGEWRLEHWGCRGIEVEIAEKCDETPDYRLVTVIRDERDGTMVLKFLTCWSAPIPWLESAGRAFPELQLSITYYGGDFGGFVEVHGDAVNYAPCENMCEVLHLIADHDLAFLTEAFSKEEVGQECGAEFARKCFGESIKAWLRRRLRP